MLIYIYGPDTFRSRQYLKDQVEKFKKARDPQGYNVVFLDGKKETSGKIITEIHSMPFLAERRMIVIENILSNNDKGLLAELISTIKDNKIPETNVVVFWQGDTLSKVKEVAELHKLLQKEKYTEEFTALDPAKLTAWIMQEIKQQGGTISRHAISYLVEHTGTDVWLLHSLIGQLVSYKNKEEIQTADVQLFLAEKADDNIFNLVDAIVAKQPKLVYKMIREQYHKGEDAQYVFAMILRQFRILLELRDLFERDDAMRSDDLAKRLGLHPFVVKKTLPFIKRFTLTQLKTAYEQLLDFDIKTKTGQGDQSVLLDVLVGRLMV